MAYGFADAFGKSFMEVFMKNKDAAQRSKERGEDARIRQAERDADRDARRTEITDKRDYDEGQATTERNRQLKSWISLIAKEDPELKNKLLTSGSYHDMDPAMVGDQYKAGRRQREIIAAEKRKAAAPLSPTKQYELDLRKHQLDQAKRKSMETTQTRMKTAWETMPTYNGEEVWKQENMDAVRQAVHADPTLEPRAYEDPDQPGFIHWVAAPIVPTQMPETFGSSGVDESRAYGDAAAQYGPATGDGLSLAEEKEAAAREQKGGSGVGGTFTAIDEVMKFLKGGYSAGGAS